MKKILVFLKKDYIVLLLVSFSLMSYEIAAARMLAPHIGSSSLVWSSVIGFVLLGLSIGYYHGGFITNQSIKIKYSFVTSLILLVLSFFSSEILVFVSGLFLSEYLLLIILTFLFLSPISYLFAIISTLAASHIISQQKIIGPNVGKVYMVGSLGGIIGTFAISYLLIPLVSISHIFLILSGVLLLIPLAYKRFSLLIFYFCFAGLLFFVTYQSASSNDFIFSGNSHYSSISVRDELDSYGNTIRRLYVDNSIQSESFLDTVELTSDYAHYYNMVFDYLDPKHVLMVGGGAYSYPKYFIHHYPEKKIDIIEIDPFITKIAKKYFFFNESENTSVYHKDARVFLSKNTNTYDAIFMDAFNGLSTPSHLATIEYITLLQNNLSKNGVVIVNIPGSIEGNYNDFLLTQIKTYQQVFSFVDIYAATYPDKPERLQNIILVASNNDRQSFSPYFNNKHRNIPELSDIEILTDDYSPTDYLNRKFDTF